MKQLILSISLLYICFVPLTSYADNKSSSSQTEELKREILESTKKLQTKENTLEGSSSGSEETTMQINCADKAEECLNACLFSHKSCLNKKGNQECCDTQVLLCMRCGHSKHITCRNTGNWPAEPACTSGFRWCLEGINSEMPKSNY